MEQLKADGITLVKRVHDEWDHDGSYVLTE